MKPRLRLSLAAVLAATAVHLAALDNPFVYDDHRMVIENASIRQAGDLRQVVLYEVTRPIPNLSYAFDFALGGLSPLPYHATNLALHLIVLAGFAALVWRLGDDAAAAGRWPQDDRAVAVTAWTATLLLAVHPVVATTVGYVAARPELLCAAFLLGALLAGRRWLSGGSTAWAVLTLAAWTSALLSKEVAVVFPVVLGALDAWLWAPAQRRSPRWAVHGGLAGAAVGAALLRLAVLARVEYGGSGLALSWELLPAQFDVFRRYVGLLAMPSGQTIFHAIPLSSWGSAGPLAGVVFVIAFLTAAWRLRDVAPPAAVGLGWFVLAVVPSSVLVLLDRAEPMAEHRLYVASLGAWLAVGVAVSALAGLRPRDDRAWNRLLAAVGIVLLASLSARTVLRHAVWASPIAVWTEAMQRAPDHWVPRQALGEALLESGRVEAAIVEFGAAIDRQPDEPLPYQKLALAQLAAGRPTEASAAFERLRARDPRSAVAADGLGAVALATGRRDDARRHFEEAIGLDPGNVPARQGLATLAEAPPGDPGLALRLCQEIRQLAPATPGNDDCIRRNQARLDPRP